MNNHWTQIQNELHTIMNQSEDVKTKITKMQELLQKAQSFQETEKAQSLACTSTIYEAMGDIYMKQNPIESEKAYRHMLVDAKNLYALDSQKFDYRFGFASYKMASYYTTMLGCTKLEEKAKQLNEMQKKAFDLAIELYKSAISTTMENAKKGYVVYAKLHAMAMNEMGLLYANVADYKQAALYALDGVNVSRSVYQSVKEKDYLYHLINRINTLATIYKLLQEEDKTIQYLLESISLAQTNMEKDKVVLGVMISKCYMNVASLYVEKKEIFKADDMVEKGLEAIAQANKDANYEMYEEVIQTYIKVGNHYKNTKRERLARSYYNVAMEKATYQYEQTQNPMYVKILKQLFEDMKGNA